MRFLHTSDWHLGRIFHGIHLTDEQAYVLDQFVQLVAEVKPEAIILAGDVYDRAVPPTEAVKLLDDVLAKVMLDYQIPFIIIAGNHDSPERLAFGNRLLAKQGLNVVGPLPGSISPVVVNDSYGPVYFWPFTYTEPALVREGWDEPAAVDHQTAMQLMINKALAGQPSRTRSVAVAHVFIAGGLQSESERPLSVGGSSAVSAELFAPFCYTALGHLHNSQQAGSGNICYSGSLMKYSFNEATQRKGVNIVEIAADGRTTVETVSLTPRHDVRCIKGYFKDIQSGPAAGENSNDYIAIQLLDSAPILDVKGRLSKIYPQILEVEYINRMHTADIIRPQADYRRQSETVLFNSFFTAMTNQELTQEQSAEFRAAVDELYREQREGKI